MLLLAGFVAADAVAQERVGITGAVNPATTGQPPGLPVRTLVLGDNIVFNETIRTAADGQAQLVFLDKSSMSIGPSSEVVIDEFAYDRGTGAGKLTATATKGLFRYIGGALSKNPDAVTIKTPSATLGIRGGVVLVFIAADGRVTIAFLFGKSSSITTASGTVVLVRPGYATVIAGPGAAPSAPFQMPSAEIAALVAQLDGRQGGNGGSGTAPTPVLVRSFAPSNSDNVQQSNADSTRSQPPQSQPPVVDTASPPQQQQAQTSTQQQGTTDSAGGGRLFDFFNFDLDHLLAEAAAGDITAQLLLDLFRSPVAGGFAVPTTITPDFQIPTTGIASFGGPLIASVSDGGVRSVNRGTFSASINFSTTATSMSLFNVGSRNFSGTGSFFGGTAFATFGDATSSGVAFGQLYNGAGGQPAQRLFGEFFISPSSGGGTPDPNGFFAVGFFDGAQTGFSDPFAPLTAFLMQDSGFAAILPNTPLTPEVNMPTVGTVIYDGSVLGATNRGGGPVIETGTYRGTFNFGSGTGTMTISGYGGLILNGFVTRGGNSSFSGSLGNGSIQGPLRGQFFDNGSIPAGIQAGSFSLQGPNYLSTGRFKGACCG